MFKREKLCLALLAAATLRVSAQDSEREFRPELNIYVNEGSRVRINFRDTFHLQPGNSQGNFAYYVEFALRPVFRRALREQDDVFRNRFLTFRSGYQYTTSLGSNDAPPENRAIAELTARYPLPHGLVLVDRNRGDFRFIKGKGFSTRYRNRLWLERDLKLKRLVVTPYVYDEIFYDTRYDAWSNNRVVFGLQFPVGPHLVVEPYLLRQINSQAAPRHTDAFGLKFSLYF
jgi:hypothetical protein